MFIPMDLDPYLSLRTKVVLEEMIHTSCFLRTLSVCALMTWLT